MPARMYTFFVQAAVPDTCHPRFELVQVVDALGLDEIDPGSDFFGQAG
jgi:hypothetical protein